MCVFSSVIPGTQEAFMTIYTWSAGRRMCPLPALQAAGAVMRSRVTSRGGVLPAPRCCPPGSGDALPYLQHAAALCFSKPFRGSRDSCGR